jgi:hypothetical protein
MEFVYKLIFCVWISVTLLLLACCLYIRRRDN